MIEQWQVPSAMLKTRVRDESIGGDNPFRWQDVTSDDIFIIATGLRPVVPVSWNGLGNRLLTTDTLFEQETLPARMAVVGMGPIGAEMAQALLRLGIQVVALGGNQTIAGSTDPQVIAVAADLFKKEFPLHLGEKAELSLVSDGVKVRAGSIEVMVDCVLAALGRRPNIDNLGLETLGVPLDEHGMPPVSPGTMQVANLPVFMAGDANDQAPLLRLPFYHPVLEEGLRTALRALAVQLPSVNESDLSMCGAYDDTEALD